MNIKLKANAKVNLSLNVLGAETFHSLDMVVASVNIADALRIYTRNDSQINVFMNSKPSNSANSAYIMAKLLTDTYDLCGADIYINKKIPFCGGMGGSSADASGVMVGYYQMFDLPLSAFKLCEKVGSDVPFQCYGGTMRVRGKGEQLAKIETALRFNLVLAKDRVGTNTTQCFKQFDIQYPDKKLILTDTEQLISSLTTNDYTAALGEFHNALTSSACSLTPSITKTLELLKLTNPLAINMSGSGSVCYGVYPMGVDTAAIVHQLIRDGLWARAACTADCGVELF